jgi:hypothetical protein
MRKLWHRLSKDPKTTISGIISGLAAYALIDYNYKDAPITFKIAQWAFSIGLVTNGVVAKDAD